MHSVIQILTAFAFLAVSIKAQVPPYIGELLLEPGLSSAKCLTAASNTEAAIVTIQPCDGSPSQKWTFGGGVIKVFGDKCLQVPLGGILDGTKLQIFTCLPGVPNQQWSYTRDNRINWTNTDKCIDLSGGSLDDGNRIQIWSCNGKPNQIWNTGYMVNDLPTTSQDGQTGINNCGTSTSPSSNCQTAWINSASDFCLWAPPKPGTIGDNESDVVAYCTKSDRGARTIPNGVLGGVHFVKTSEYVQITGVGDFTKMNIPSGDVGGELDNKGGDGKGNPVGGLVYGDSFGTGLQYHEWISFMSDKEFCFRACVGASATSLCNHIYDLQGCYWNIPANYEASQFENCDADPAQPMGVYGTSTWYQGVSPTPAPHPAPSSSNCEALPTVSVSPALQRRNSMVRRHPQPAFAGATPAPLL